MKTIDALSVPATPSAIAETYSSRSYSFEHQDEGSHREATLGIDIAGRIQFTCPKTWTYEEAAAAITALQPQLARARCYLLVQNLPAEILPTVFPQFADIADHEIRMWQVRNTFRGPDIHEDRRLLPVAK